MTTRTIRPSGSMVDGQFISVIVATYNRGENIIPTLKSVLHQTRSQLELIVVDDGSEVSQEPFVKSMNDSRIRFLRHPTNQGVANAYNTGISAARGDLISFLDHDDIAEADWLDRLASAFEADRLVGMAWGQVQQHQLNGLTRITFLDPYRTGNRQLIPIMLTRTHGTTGAMVRSEVFEQLGTMDPGVGWMADRDFTMRFASDGRWRVHAEEKILLHKYATGQNLSERHDKLHIEALKYLLVKHQAALSQFPCARSHYLYLIGRYSERYDQLNARNYIKASVESCPRSAKYLCYFMASSPRLRGIGRLAIDLIQRRGALFAKLIR